MEDNRFLYDAFEVYYDRGIVALQTNEYSVARKNILAAVETLLKIAKTSGATVKAQRFKRAAEFYTPSLFDPDEPLPEDILVGSDAGEDGATSYAMSRERRSIEKRALELFEEGAYADGFALLEGAEGMLLPDFENLTCFYIARCFEEGYGIEPNAARARFFYDLAENGDERGSDENLGKCYYFLGMKYACGSFFAQSDERAFALFERASRYQNGNALYNLGICYKSGRGCAQSFDEAFLYFTEASNYIPEDASYQLALCFAEGLGVEKNLQKAVEHYRMAAELGNPKAMCGLGELYYYGDGVEQDYDIAFDWYQAAARQGEACAQYQLGWCYFAGVGVEKDTEAAQRWMERAAKNGNKKAAHFIVDHF